MSNFKNIPDSNFTIVRNEMLYNDQLSLKAKGLLAVMRSFPPDWVYRQSHLLKLSTDGRDSMRAGLKELLDYGYVRRTQTRNPDGTLAEAEYHVTDAEPTVDGKPDDGYPDDGQAEATNTHITKTKKTNQNPSSTFVDVSASKPTSSAREVPAEPSSLKRFATAEELNASPKEKEPRARANNKDDALIEELAEIWNSNRGPLPRTLATTKDIRVKLQRFIRDCRESDLDPVQALTIATRTVVASGFYAKGFRGNRRARGLGNLLANGNWVKHYESGLAEVEEQAPSFDFAPGQRVRWLKHRMVPQRGYYYGVVLGEGSNDRVRIAPESGFSSDEVNIRPDFLELADDA